MSSIVSQASAAAQPSVHRRRLIALSSPFRVNPLAGQVIPGLLIARARGPFWVDVFAWRVYHRAAHPMPAHSRPSSALPLTVCQPLHTGQHVVCSIVRS